MRFSPYRTSGMTLVELLVVLVIIVLMVSLLLPALTGARESAFRTYCATNLDQIGVACLLYAKDHNELWPVHGPSHRPGSWSATIARNTGQPDEPAGPVNHGKLVQFGYMAIQSLWCPRSARTDRAMHELYDPCPPFTAEPNIEMWPTPPLNHFCHSTYIRSGPQLSDGVHQHPEVIRESSVSENWFENTDRAVFTEFFYNHEDGVNALYGDGSVTFVHVPPSKWEAADPVIFDYLMEVR